MKKVLGLLILLFTIFLISCEENDVPPTQEICDPICEDWKECNSGTCTVRFGFCETDDNCKNNTDGKTVCGDDHLCKEPIVNECIGMSFDTIEVQRYKNELMGIAGDYQLTIGFYDADSPVGTYDLASGTNNNYSTCNQCVTVSKFTDETLDKTFFQESGTLEISSGDGRTGESVGDVKNIKLIEVTIADSDYLSVPVENGECIEIETGKTWAWDTLCTEGNKRCNDDDNTIETCQADHTWETTTLCLETELCTISVDNGIICEAPFCIAGEKRCNDLGNVETCSDDGSYWELTKSCLGTTICEDTNFTCIEPPCTEGDKKCNADNSGIETCISDGTWVEALCAVDTEVCTGNQETTVCEAIATTSEWVQISIDSVSSCGIKEVSGVNKLYCWGTGSYGRLGNNTLDNKLTPTEVDITENSDWSDISVGGYHACGIKSGKVYCWGRNNYGQLGDASDVEERLVPTEIAGINSDFVSVEVGGGHSCAIKNDGKLFCWGRGDYGQLGNALTDNLNTPTEITGNWVSVSLGDKHSCGIKNENNINKLYCWGYGLYGRLGVAIGDTSDRDIPTEVAGTNSDWVKIFSGYAHNCAIKTTGKMYCWGHGNSFKLGTGSEDNAEVPTEIPGDNWVNAAIGYYHSCGVKTVNNINKAFCWGKGTNGRLGVNSEDEKTSPTEVQGDNWDYIQVGLSHSCGIQVIDSKNVLNCWGKGTNGRLGTGDEDEKWVPTNID